MRYTRNGESVYLHTVEDTIAVYLYSTLPRGTEATILSLYRELLEGLERTGMVQLPPYERGTGALARWVEPTILRKID